MFKKSIYWFIAIILSLLGGFLFFERSLLSDMVVFIGALSGVVVLYIARKEPKKGMPAAKKRTYLLMGSFVCAFSFVNQILAAVGVPVHFWNPPYSLGEFGVLLSGLSIILFAYLEYRPLIIPSAFPALVLIVYQVYDIYSGNVEWIASPLMWPTTNLSIAVLNLIGIKAVSAGDYFIRFLTRDGQPMSIQIVTDCTGIWSLSAFTASLILVSLGLKNVFSKKAIPYILIGYIGTYAANILRIVAICTSAYLYGHSGATEGVHMHAGWVAFSGWMLIFWYFFFSRFLLKKEADRAKR